MLQEIIGSHFINDLIFTTLGNYSVVKLVICFVL